MSKLIDAVNFAFETVITDERFLDSNLTPEDAETVVHEIITTQFPKCFKTLGPFIISNIEEQNIK